MDEIKDGRVREGTMDQGKRHERMRRRRRWGQGGRARGGNKTIERRVWKLRGGSRRRGKGGL